MASTKTQARTIRLSTEQWAELDYAAAVNGRTRNDEIKWRLEQHRVQMPEVVADGQTAMNFGFEGTE